MSGDNEIIRYRDLPYSDPWLEKKFQLFQLLSRLGLKKRYGKSARMGMWVHVW